MKGDFIGQTQKWFLLYYEGDDSEIRLIPDNDSGLYQEFEDWKWENSKNVIDLVINFKKDTYIKVFKEFTDLGIL
jgi:putative (di)nucleoside polyphosphate hydrolase